MSNSYLLIITNKTEILVYCSGHYTRSNMPTAYTITMISLSIGNSTVSTYNTQPICVICADAEELLVCWSPVCNYSDFQLELFHCGFYSVLRPTCSDREVTDLLSSFCLLKCLVASFFKLCFLKLTGSVCVCKHCSTQVQLQNFLPCFLPCLLSFCPWWKTAAFKKQNIGPALFLVLGP